MKCYLYFKGDIFLYSSDEKYPLDTCCDQTKMTLDILVEVYSCIDRMLKIHYTVFHYTDKMSKYFYSKQKHFYA